MGPHERDHQPEHPAGGGDRPRSDAGPATDPGTGLEPGVCPMCDVVNDLFVAPRAFVRNWRLAGEGE